MADEKKEENKEEAKEAAAPPKKSMLPLMIIGGCLLLGLAIGIPTTFYLLKGEDIPVAEELPADAAKPEETQAEQEAGAVSFEAEELKEGEEVIGAIFPLETFVVNLNTGRYIRCQIQVEFVEREVPKVFYNKLIIIRDAIIGLLAAKKSEDILDPRGRLALKTDLKDLINEQLHKQEVKNIYFSQFVVQ